MHFVRGWHLFCRKETTIREKLLVIIVLCSIRTNIVYKLLCFWCHLLLFGIMTFFHLKIKRKSCEFFLIVKDGNVWKFCDDHILIKVFFGCIIDIQKYFKKKRREPASLKADKQLNAILCSFLRTLLLMFVFYACIKPKNLK